MKTIAPGVTQFLVTAHDVGEPNRFFSVSAAHPGRMIYSENYLFDASGTFLRTDGFSDGEAGKQAVYSIYRLHFGHFGRIPVKFVYGPARPCADRGFDDGDQRLVRQAQDA